MAFIFDLTGYQMFRRLDGIKMPESEDLFHPLTPADSPE
jgi:hypothetical protein